MHRAIFILLLTVGTAWAALLVVGGAAVPGLLPGFPAVVAWLVGLAVIAAGEYVFLTVVGDRLFPLASRRLVSGAEVGLGVAMLALVASAGVVMLVGGES